MSVTDVKWLQAIEGAAASGQLVVVHYWAPWCEPCKHMDQVMAQLAAEYPQAAFMRVEAEEVEGATVKHEVSTVPTFVFIKGGRTVDRLEGADAPSLTAKTAAAASVGAQEAGAAAAPANGQAANGPPSGGGVEGRIKWLLAENPILLFMKGMPDAPRCGFSSKVVDALKSHQVPFKAVDILADQELRDGVKAFGNWPTYPQLYVKGELIGGCDIILEMQKSGELGGVLKSAAPQQQAPSQPAASPPAPAANGNLEGRIKSIISQNPVMLFMKGNPEEPRCGFSRKVAEALRSDGISFGSFDILSDQAVREGLKAYSNWPTYPQVYVKGELLGGCDIVLQMQEAGELKSTVDGMI